MRRMLPFGVLFFGASAWAQPSATPPTTPAPPPAAAPAPAVDPSGAPMAQPAPVQPAPPPQPELPAAQPVPYAPAPPPSDRGLDAGVLEDANATTAMFMPTALTPPGGTFGFHSYELFFVGGSYAVTDRMLLSVTALVPLVADMGFNGIFSGKYQVIRSPKLKVAVHASTGIIGSDADLSAGLFGGVATVCVSSDCATHVSGYGAVGLASGDQSTYPFVFAGALVLRASKRLRFVAEVDSALLAGEINDTSDAFLLWYGLRFASPHISADFGFVKPMSTDGDWTSDVFPLGFPIVSFTYRSE